MLGYKIEIKANTNGDLGWGMHIISECGKKNDADTSDIINVIQKLTHFTKELETLQD